MNTIYYIERISNEYSSPDFKKFSWSDIVFYKNLMLNTKVKLHIKILRKFLSSIFFMYQNSLIKKHQIFSEEFKKQNSENHLTQNFREKIFIPRQSNYIEYKRKLNSKLIKLKSGTA